VVVLERDDRVGEDRQSDRGRAQQRHVARDEARLLEPPQTPPAGRRREADALGELLVGDARIRLELLEDAAVEAIEVALHGNNIAKYGLQSEISAS
jgi:hypothetical protein